jgi:hypothetical protein
MFYAKRAQADGQYAHRQAEQDGLAASAGRRPSRAFPLGPVYTGRPEALQQGATQIFWGEIELRNTERLSLVCRLWGRLGGHRQGGYTRARLVRCPRGAQW